MNARQCIYSKGNIEVVRAAAANYDEYFFNVRPCSGDTSASMLQRLRDAVQAVNASFMSIEVFGGLGSSACSQELIADVLGAPAAPVTWVEEMSERDEALAGIQAWAIAGADIQPIHVNETCLGVYVDLPEVRYCRLGGITPCNTDTSAPDQANEVFALMSVALDQCCMSFRNVMRTWFFNHHLLTWYGPFNRVRDSFFKSCDICGRMTPASTGIEGGNPRRAALIAGALAVVPKMEGVSTAPIASPLQCPALDYGSSFSRAAEIQLPGLRRLYVSGTASISPEGDSQYLDDTPAQIARTMEVVEAILQSREMSWHNINRALLYFKHRQDFSLFNDWREKRDLMEFPALFVHNDVCRDDLLFEIELDALLPTA